jgi:outer membrane protein assembly factor BamB
VFQAAANGEISAFDAAGIAGCSVTPRTFTRRFFAVASGIPSVADGTLYALTPNGRLSAFDATGTERCSARSRQCRALRSYDLPPIQCTLPGPCGSRSPAAIVNGVIYINSTFLKNAGFAALTAFDASGQTNCSGTPPRCGELAHWDDVGPSPAIANRYLFASTFAPAEPRLNAYGPP